MDGLRDSIIHRLGLLREQHRAMTAQAQDHQAAAQRAASEGLVIAGRIAELELLMQGFEQAPGEDGGAILPATHESQRT